MVVGADRQYDTFHDRMVALTRNQPDPNGRYCGGTTADTDEGKPFLNVDVLLSKCIRFTIRQFSC
jgi:hypothetical protein